MLHTSGGGGVAFNLTVQGWCYPRLRSPLCLSASVMHHKVCLSSLTQCISASSTTVLLSSSAKTHCLMGLKQAVLPPFSRSACVDVRTLLNAGNCVKAEVVLLSVSFRYPFYEFPHCLTLDEKGSPLFFPFLLKTWAV